jgi:RimJ/RimL family protein N-acetyltransferase
VWLNAGPVVLRPVAQRDRDPLAAILMDAAIMRWALDERAMTRDEADAFLDAIDENRDDVLQTHAIAPDVTGPAVGFGGYRACRLLGAEDVEFGWVIATPHQGRGYATALGQAFIRYALDDLKLPRILAACNPANAPSLHILREKLGMRFEQEVEPRPGLRRRVYSAASDGLWSPAAREHPVAVRRVTADEAADLCSLVEEYYEAASVVLRDDRERLLSDYVSNVNGGAWVATCGSEAAGCILYHPLPGREAAGEVKRLYVRPAFRRRQIAQRLLERLERFAVSRGDEWLYLDTNDSLRAAIAFYERNGYRRCPRYNENPQATIFMRKRIRMVE